MGCGTSSAAVNRGNSAGSSSGSSSRDAEKSPTTIQEEIKSKRAMQSFVTNLVTEIRDRDIRDFYDIDSTAVLGTGISGEVRIAIHKATRTEYALKTLNKKKVKEEKLQQLKEEIRIMTLMDHPNILRLQECFENKNVIYLVLELCRGGELLDRLHAHKGSQFTEKVACRYIYTILSAVRYCHAQNIVHRDLKLENFLFEDESPESALKLIDFGLSQHFKPNETLSSAVGTPYYVSPEVLEGNYNAKCDIWSIGVIAYMLLSGTPPFCGKNDSETLQAVRVGRWKFDDKLFKPISANAKSFITACLQRRLEKRPSADEAIAHPWFRLLQASADDDESETMVSLDIIERLKGFDKRSSLTKLCLEVVAHTLQNDQIATLRNEFSKLDVNKNGQISLGDLRVALEQHGSFREEDLKHIFSGVDFDQTGTIYYHEFLAATVSRKNITEGNIKVAFDRISNHNEYITSEDIENLLGTDATKEDGMHTHIDTYIVRTYIHVCNTEYILTHTHFYSLTFTQTHVLSGEDVW